MKKVYLFDEDKYSGQIVIVCETKEVGYTTVYTVKGYYHYEDVENREDNCLFEWTAFDMDYANQLFKDAMVYLK